jgi:4-oxalocrotonate tautomerase
MPYINLKLTPDGLTEEIKAELIKEFTDILVKKLGKNPATTIMTIEEVETENWGIGGQTVKSIRAKN